MSNVVEKNDKKPHPLPFVKRLLFILPVISLLFPGALNAQSINYTVTTYHPSPSGSYDRIRFFRQDASVFSQPCQPGTFAVDQDGDLQFCGALGLWTSPDPVWDEEPSLNTVFLKDWTNPDAFVGIGTSTPLAKFHIASPDDTNYLRLSGTSDAARRSSPSGQSRARMGEATRR